MTHAPLTLAPIVALAMLVACSPVETPPAPPAPVPEPDTCGAGDYINLVGENIAAITLPSELDARIVGPDDAVTLDFRPERLNILTDEDGTVTGVRCG